MEEARQIEQEVSFSSQAMRYDDMLVKLTLLLLLIWCLANKRSSLSLVRLSQTINLIPLDDEWKCSSDLPTVKDSKGNTVNCLEFCDESGGCLQDGLDDIIDETRKTAHLCLM